MNVVILGSGFGLYGYLPALSNIKNITIFLLSRYKTQFYKRPDINLYFDTIQWVDDVETLLKLANTLIIALTPAQQYFWIKKCLSYQNINYIFCEKPLATTPDLANDLFENLVISGKKFRIAYNFRYTDWGWKILNSFKNIGSITWNFQAHHYKKNIQNWKRQHTDGGGALRFYGIHLIALFSELGYNNTSYSEIKNNKKNEAESWCAEITGDNLTNCKLNISTNSPETSFIIEESNGQIYSLLHPFQTNSMDKESIFDQRIPFITKALIDLFGHPENYYGWYKHTNRLWKNIEERTLHNEKNFCHNALF